MAGLIETCFMELEDPRGRRGRTHSLTDVLTIFFLAVLSGADDVVEVAEYAEAKEPLLRSILALPGGIPSHDTFGRVLAALDPAALEKCFMNFTTALVNRKFGGQTGQSISIDGKTIRRSFQHAWRKNPAHVVSVYLSERGLVLCQKKVDEKSNEIKAIPELLKLLDLNGKVVRIDAMGTQRNIARQIAEARGFYVLPLKDNQPTARAKVQTLMDEGILDGFKGMKHDYCEQTEGGHGRIDSRQVWVTPEVHHFKNFEPFAGMGTLAAVVNTRRLDTGETTVEKHYFVSNIPDCSAEKMLGYVRGHWGVENGLHWRLDVCFKEDQSRVRCGHAAENFSRMRRLAFNLLRAETTYKASMKCKRKRAGWDDAYLYLLLGL